MLLLVQPCLGSVQQIPALARYIISSRYVHQCRGWFASPGREFCYLCCQRGSSGSLQDGSTVLHKCKHQEHLTCKVFRRKQWIRVWYKVRYYTQQEGAKPKLEGAALRTCSRFILSTFPAVSSILTNAFCTPIQRGTCGLDPVAM
jgi:hypothetical protein